MSVAGTIALVDRIGQCPECEYALDGLPDEGSCPECGFSYDASMWSIRGLDVRRRRMFVKFVVSPVVLAFALALLPICMGFP